MKTLLLSTAILAFALGPQASASSDLTLVAPTGVAPTGVAPPMTAPAKPTQVAASDLRLRPGVGQPVSVQLVGIGDNSIARPGSRYPADGRDVQPPAEGLPSTPIALATLLLLLCRLIGRRSS